METTYTLKSDTISIKNAEIEDKPNEDCFIVDDSNGIYIVADGVTSTPKSGEKYPNPSGGQLAARTFCEAVHEHLISHKEELQVDPDGVVKRALNVANQEVYSLNQAHNRYAEANFVDKDYFGTVGTVVVATKDRLHIFHVGDVMVLLKRAASLRLITDSQTRNAIEYGKKVQDSGIILPRDLMITSRKDFRNNINARGSNGEKVGYGVFTGEKGVLDFIQTYEVPIQSGDTLLILSDGLSPLINDVVNSEERAQLFYRLIDKDSETLDWMIRENERLAKRSDDKTAIIINVNG